MKNLRTAAVFIIISLISLTQLHAQVPGFMWSTQTSGIGDELVMSISDDPKGNVYIGGSMSDYFDFEGTTVNNFGGFFYDGYVARYSRNGGQSWAIPIGGSGIGFCSARRMSVDPDGNLIFIASGFTQQTVDTFNIGNNYQYIIDSLSTGNIIVKLDSTGNVIWVTEILNTNGGVTASNLELITDSDGNFFVSGFMTGTLLFDTISINPIGNWDGQFLAKGDSNGNFIWAKSFGSKGNDGQTFRMTMNNQEEIFLSGGWEGDTIFIDSLFLVNPTPGGFFNTDRYICKFDPSGNALWLVGEGGNQGDEPAYMVPDANGGVACFSRVGDGYSITINEGGTTINGDVFLVTKYDSQGDFQSYFTHSSINTGYISGMTGYHDDYYIAFTFTDPTFTIDGNTIQNAGGTSGTSDMVMAKTDTAGNVIWVMSLGGLEEESYGTFVYSDQNGMMIGGSTASDKLILGNDTINNAGLLTKEAFVTSIQANNISISENEISTSISAYPNPARNILNLDLSELNNQSIPIKLISANGRVVKRMLVNGGSMVQVDLKDLAVGVYLIELKVDENYAVKKFIKN